ncbi:MULTISPECIES: ABC transporter permease [unclassified Imperialibacter]|jgi:lipopolysaccharide transport system permease protein|uniref:ABC transporter permease n=1 Tax=unclassified Imperialibacter TaxID=2629706 RepID=UPI00125A6A25|nr:MULTISPECIES: ABC transporter permease [unclassified Imperialibacter]CAD5259149.1 Transport permease protein [Imperialibacter sp. 89]CAD5279977.1 Transport permease protein [Imperialibacter sp. 75]VVT31784.1 Transport permease protein [Imperialibacter sp. EC-SDR9]
MDKRNFTLIVSSRPWWKVDFRELLDYRDLFLVLTYKDLRVRYAQTFLGLAWVVVQPIVTLFIFTLIFGKAINVDTGGVPYPIFALAGMSAWNYFAFVMAQSGGSIIGAQDMVKKIYFPRLVLPLSKAIVGLVDFVVALVLLGVVMLYYQQPFSSNVGFVFVFFLFNFFCSLAMGVWLSALTIRFRDFQHVVPFMVQIGLYASPIAYPSSMVPEKWQLYYYLNPMAGIVEGMRWSLIGGGELSHYSYISFGITVLLFITGVLYFHRTERIIADIV